MGEMTRGERPRLISRPIFDSAASTASVSLARSSDYNLAPTLDETREDEVRWPRKEVNARESLRVVQARRVKDIANVAPLHRREIRISCNRQNPPGRI